MQQAIQLILRVSLASGRRLEGTNVARRQRILLIATFAMILLASGGAWYLFQGPDPVRGTRTSGPAAVPVTIATATKRDLPIYLTGLGTVQASFTVAIRPQVDGKLQEVLFIEGRHVRKGDILAKIDARLVHA